MFDSINRSFSKEKADRKNHEFIMESVLDTEEVLPGSEDEMDNEVDVDSVPTDVYKKIDKSLDDMIQNGEYDDTEVEEMVDDDIPDEEIEAVITEAVEEWESEEEKDTEDDDDESEEDDDPEDEEDDDDDDDEEDDDKKRERKRNKDCDCECNESVDYLDSMTESAFQF